MLQMETFELEGSHLKKNSEKDSVDKVTSPK